MRSDLVGERWSLADRPRATARARSATPTCSRACPESGTNILAARLRDLEGGGDRREAQAPAARGLDGLRADRVRPRARRAAVRARPLGRPFARRPRPTDEDFYPGLGPERVRCAARPPRRRRGSPATYVVRVADDVYTGAALEDSTVHVEVGAVRRADLDFATDRERRSSASPRVSSILALRSQAAT